MAESQASSSSRAAEADRVPDLDAGQLRQLTELVYRLIKDQAILEKERRGAGFVRDRR